MVVNRALVLSRDFYDKKKKKVEKLENSPRSGEPWNKTVILFLLRLGDSIELKNT